MQNTIFKFSISAIPLVFLLACADNDKTTGFWQEMLSDSPINTYKQRTGKQIYEYRCQTCHARNTQGAPVPGDHYEWNKRRAKGMDVLLKHATEGYKRGLMPPRGGCNDCSDIELENAILYMLNTSKIDDQPFLKYKDP